MSTSMSVERSAPVQELFDGLETLPSSKRFTLEQLETIYALGYSHIAQGQYEQALPILAFLAQYGPTQRHYLYGLALCLQMEGRLDDAISIYSFCLLLYPDSFEATQRIAQCQVEAHCYEEAYATLQSLLEYANASGDALIKQKAKGMLAVIGQAVIE